MTPHIDAIALLPEITVTSALVLTFLVDLFLRESSKRVLATLSFLVTLVPLICSVMLLMHHRHASMLGGTYVVDDFALTSKCLLIACVAFVFLLGEPATWKGEYCTLIFASLLGMVMVVSGRDLVTFFVAFELLAVPGYLLAGWNKRLQHGHEAALKYYLLGVVSTAVMLYGLSLLFGLAGSTRFKDLADIVGIAGVTGVPLLRLAVLFVIVGMGFKVSAVPFHFWAPDTYKGAPVPVAAFLSVASKGAGLLALVMFLSTALPRADLIWGPLLLSVAAVTMTVGNLAALRQRDIVRLLAYSSIAQAGYMLMPLAVSGHYGGGRDAAVSRSMEFLFVYAISNLGAFAVVVAMARRCGSTSLSKYTGLFRSAPVLAVSLTASVLSLAGIPPFGGWFAKLVVIRAAIDAGTPPAIFLAIVAAINTAIGLVYYARLVREMWIEEPGPDDVHHNLWLSSGLAAPLIMGIALSVLGLLATGVLPSIVTHVGELSSLAR